MGARSLNTKYWGWAFVRRRCLNGSTIPVQVPTLDAKLAARGYQIDLHCRGQPNGRESYIALESRPTCNLVPKFPQRLLLAVCKFCATGKQHCKWGHGQVWVNLWCQMSWCHQYLISAYYLRFTMRKFRNQAKREEGKHIVYQLGEHQHWAAHCVKNLCSHES